jgi:ribosomal protein S18 acetylase RimI-like enzyme
MMAYPGRLGVITLGTTPELSSRLNEGTDSLARLAVLQIAEQIQLDFIAQQSVGVEAVQLVAESQNTAQLAILQLAGFEHLATLYQMGCNLRELDSTTTSPDYMTLKTSIETTSTTSQGLHFALVHPTQVDVARLTRLVSETFIDTLDCPRMSDIRSDDATVESYLDGATADRTAEPLPWIVAVENSKWVGCVLLNRTHPGIAELAYVGVIPSARHRGLGRRLVQLGCRMAIDHGIEQTWLAVDANNAAAMRLYRKPRFATLRKVDAWFRW